jgi:DNA polymerase (family 10)
MRENLGEIEVAARHELPKLIEAGDIKGDLHMHTTASDGHNSILEMAEAALAVGYSYVAITDHSKILAMTGGLDERRALEHIKNIQEVDRRMVDRAVGRIRVFSGIEVDILADGALDMDDEVLAQMDVVIASVHTRFEQSREEMTARVIKAIENPNVRILGHPTGRLLLRREPFALDMGAVLRRARELGVAVEHNAAPERLDLNDRDLRLAKELGCHITINSDSHDARNLGRMQYGLRQLRRAWLGPEDVLNTLDAGDLLAALRPRG